MKLRIDEYRILGEPQSEEQKIYKIEIENYIKENNLQNIVKLVGSKYKDDLAYAFDLGKILKVSNYPAPA